MGTITEQYASPIRASSEVSPLRHVRGITSRSQARDPTQQATYDTYRALPSPTQPYSNYDWAIIAEIIRAAEAAVGKAYNKGQGSGLVTLQSVLLAYQSVLPRHGVKPDEDTFYYRLLLKLSLDPHPDWWVKLGRESAGAIGARSAGGAPVSPTRPSRPSHGGSVGSNISLAPSGIPGRQSPYRPQHQHAAMQAAAQASAQAVAAAAAAREALNAARAAAQGTGNLPSARMGYSTPAGISTDYGYFRTPAHSAGGGLGSPSGGSFGPDSPNSASAGPYSPYGSPVNAASQYGPGSSRYGLPSARTTGEGGASAAAGTGGGSSMFGDPYGPYSARNPTPRVSFAGEGGGGGVGGGPVDLEQEVTAALSEEAEAQLEYSRMARAFRTWRKNVFLLRTQRYERDQALHNWAVATSFWAVHLLRRCFRRWAGLGPQKAGMALALWSGNSLAGFFRSWLALVRYLKSKGQLCDGHHRERKLQRCLRHWRQFTSSQVQKNISTLRALDFWAGRSLRGCWSAWRLFVAQAQAGWSLAGQHLMHRMLLKWRVAARMRLDRAHARKAIQAADERRLAADAMRTLIQASIFRKESGRRLLNAVARMRNTLMARAFSKWFEVQRWKRHKRARLAVSLAHWRDRTLGRAWNAWREAVNTGALYWQVARMHARKILRPLLSDAFYAWVFYHEEKGKRNALWQDGREMLAARKQAVVVLAWRKQVLGRKQLLGAFNAIMTQEAHRLMGSSFKQWYRQHSNGRRAEQAQQAVQRGLVRRCVRHWKALSRAKRLHGQWRGQQLAKAATSRTLRCLTAWRLTAALQAEHGRLVQHSLHKLQRQQVHRMLWSWRGRVLYAMQKRMKLLAALLFWERGLKHRAWKAWHLRIAGWRLKAAKHELAGRHYRGRRMAMGLGVLLAGWQAYQTSLTRALVYRSLRNDLLKKRMVAEWRQLVGWLQWKNDKQRRALAHVRTRLMGSALYGWYAVTRHRLAIKAAVTAAVLHWMVKRRAACFIAWRNCVAYRGDLRARASGYGLVRAARAKEKVLLALKANVIRMARIARAVAHRERYLARLALSGWLLRTLLAADFAAKLRVVGTQLDVALVADALEAWRCVTSYRHYKRGMLHAALRYWRLSKQRAVLDGLRWNAVRRKLERAVVLRGRMGSVARVLRAWRDEADYRRELRDRYSVVLSGNRRAALKRGLELWRDYLGHRRGKKQLQHTAVQHWLKGAAGRAFSGWKDYLVQLREAEQRAKAIAHRWRKRDAAEALAAFAEYAALRRKRRAAEALFYKTRGRQALNAWRDWVKMKSAVDFWSGNRLSEAVNAWRAHVLRKKGLRGTMGHVASRWRNLMAAQALGSWRGYADERRRLKELGRLLSSRTRRGALSEALRNWRGYSQYRSHLKHAADQLYSRTRGGVLRGALSSWRDWALRRLSLAEIAALVSGKARKSTMAKLLRAWHDTASYRGRLHSAARHVAERLMRGTLSGAFGTWRGYASRMASLKSLLTRVFMRTASLAFYGWRQAVSEGQMRRAQQQGIRARIAQKPELAEIAAYSMARLRNWPLALAFYTWFDNAAESAYLRNKASNAIFMYAGSLLRKAWVNWEAYALRNRMLKEKLTRFAIAMGAKSTRKVFDEWRRVAKYLARLHVVANMIETKLYGRTKREALREWRAAALQRIRLRGILTRVMSRHLSTAWESWRQAIRDKHARLQVMGAMLARWLHRHLSMAFNAWRDLVARHAAARRLTVRVLGRLLDASWLAWKEAVFQGALERGGALHVSRLLRRAWHGWRGRVAEARRMEDFVAQQNHQLAFRALGEWRRQWLARAAMRRLYTRRALLGWHGRTQELREARARLWGAARLILFGSLARCFMAWLQFTQTMNLKRAVFARKQRALAEALRMGQSLVRRKEAELLEVTFKSWRFQAGLFKRLARRLNALRERSLGLAFRQWRDYAETKRAREMKKVHYIRVRLVERPFRTWRTHAQALAVETREHAHAAEQQYRVSLLSRTLAAWRLHHAVVLQRAGVLRRALAAAAAAHARELKARVLHAWCEYVERQMEVLDLVDRMGGRRRARIMGDVFDVWYKYTQAMREGGIDPGSPYLSPRDRRDERRLITRMAAMAGNVQAVDQLDATTDDPLAGLYPTAGLTSAVERRQQLSDFLNLAHRAATPAVPPTAAAGRRAPSAGRGTAGRGAEAAGGGYVRSGRGPRRRDSELSDGSASTGFSSGAGGADLTEQALYVVRATPGIVSPGKGRGPASGMTQAHVSYALQQRQEEQQAQQQRRPTPSRIAAGPAASTAAPTVSPYNDRLDLAALYQTGSSVAAPGFGGFAPQYQPGPSLPSPVPLQRAPTPLTASGPIAPRRIDFGPGLLSQQRPGLGAGPAYGYPRGGPAVGPPGYGAQGYGAQGYGAQGYGGLGQKYEEEFVSDTASTTSSDLMGPAAARERAAAAAAAAEAAAAASAPYSAVRGGRPGSSGRHLDRAPSFGGSSVGGSEQASALRSVPSPRGGSAYFMGGPLARQGGPAAPSTGGGNVLMGGGAASRLGSVLDRTRVGALGAASGALRPDYRAAGVR